MANWNGATDWQDTVPAEAAPALIGATQQNSLVKPSGWEGYRTVLFGDSMTDLYQQVQAPVTSLVYNATNGELTVGYTAHQQAVGWYTYYWDRNYPVLNKVGRYQVVRRNSADELVLQIGAGLEGVPNGTLAVGSASMRPESLQNAETWFTWFQYINGNRFKVVYNGAQSGDTTEECLIRLQEACLDYEPDVVFMQMPGVNESGILDTPSIIADRQLLVDRILAQVPKLVILTTTPVATGEVRATARIMQRVQQMNQALKAYVADKPNVLLVDAYGAIVNPTDTTGLAQTNLLRTSDQIHYSMRGGKAIADLVWNQVQSAFPTRSATLPTSTADTFASSAVALTAVTRANNVITATSAAHGYLTGDVAKVFSATGASEALNAWVVVTRVDANTVSFPSVGTAGSITGTISLGSNNNLFSNPLNTGAFVGRGGGTAGTFSPNLGAFTTESGGVAMTFNGSPQAHPSGYGFYQRVAVVFGDANDRGTLFTTFTDDTRHIRAGRSYVLEAEVNLTGVATANLSEIRFNLAFILDGITYQTYSLAGYTSGATLNTDSGLLHLKTPPLFCPTFSSISQARMDFTVRGGAAGTGLTVDIGRIALREYDPAVHDAFD
jgi:lysophospholipase L1-like esterase